jgi:hypothetical protein
MIEMTNSVLVSEAQYSLVGWQVVDVDDVALSDPPEVNVLVQVQGSGNSPYGLFWLTIFDSEPSQGLAVNPAPSSLSDHVLVTSQEVSGAYTAVAAAWNGPTTPADRSGRLLAVEVALVSAGLVASELQGTQS